MLALGQSKIQMVNTASHKPTVPPCGYFWFLHRCCDDFLGVIYKPIYHPSLSIGSSSYHFHLLFVNKFSPYFFGGKLIPRCHQRCMYIYIYTASKVQQETPWKPRHELPQLLPCWLYQWWKRCKERCCEGQNPMAVMQLRSKILQRTTLRVTISMIMFHVNLQGCKSPC